MDELIVQMNEAVGRGDWSSAVMLGGDLYGMACNCGDRVCAETAREIVAAALLALEYPGLWSATMPLAKVVSERLNGLR